MKYSLDISIFLKRFLVFPILLFSSISVHCSFKKALSLLAYSLELCISWVNLSLSALSFTSLFFLTICKNASDNHFVILHFYIFGVVLVTASCTMLLTSVHSSSYTLFTRFKPLNLFVASNVWPKVKRY